MDLQAPHGGGYSLVAASRWNIQQSYPGKVLLNCTKKTQYHLLLMVVPILEDTNLLVKYKARRGDLCSRYMYWHDIT